uniref:Neurotransmitter-gated ion-channel ligand-binding domain-containing protein n=1 Tax=Plectus sambesii TaxID=2011161 RepID=A0A914W2Y4_9BILA
MYMGWKAFFFLLQTSGQITLLLASSEHTLKKRLFEDYDREIRPVKLLSTTTNISVDSKIYSILSINEQEESIELIINTRLAWTDELLTWNPQDYDNCSKIRTLASNVWLPDFVFMNILDEVAVVPFDKQYLSIDSNGTIVLPMSSHSTLRCGMDITQFPFDTQGNSEFVTVSFTGKTVIHTAADKNVTFSEVHFTLKLKRRPEYYIFVLVVPSFLLTSMCIIGIFTPNSNVGERNEKMTLGLTTLLSMAVILNIAADEMPKSAKGLPLLGKRSTF